MCFTSGWLYLTIELSKFLDSCRPLSLYCDNYSGFAMYSYNKKFYRAFSRQANQLILNIPVLKGLLRVTSKAEKNCELTK